jgi:hypothetical protein
MPARHAAQLYTSHFWHSGVLASSALSCRATTAAAIVALNPPCLSKMDRTRLQQLARSSPKSTRSAPQPQGFRDRTPNRVDLATVIDPSTGQRVVYTPPKKYHQLGSAKTMYQLLHNRRSAGAMIIATLATIPTRHGRTGDRRAAARQTSVRTLMTMCMGRVSSCPRATFSAFLASPTGKPRS